MFTHFCLILLNFLRGKKNAYTYTIPPNTEIVNLKAKECLETGEYSKAYTLFCLVNMRVPNDISVMLNMAECKYRQKEYYEAKKHIETILNVFPGQEDALELLEKIKEGDVK